jgi:hypothetical protein
MNTSAIRFRCSKCRARIKAPVQLIGRQRNCPACNHSLTVPCVLPEDAGPHLVLLEQDERFTLAIRTTARAARVPMNYRWRKTA